MNKTGQRHDQPGPRRWGCDRKRSTASNAIATWQALVAPASWRDQFDGRRTEARLKWNTIRTHMSHLYTKLGTHSRTQAVERARALGLLAPLAPRARRR
jgi:hypothetical protein